MKALMIVVTAILGLGQAAAGPVDANDAGKGCSIKTVAMWGMSQDPANLWTFRARKVSRR